MTGIAVLAILVFAILAFAWSRMTTSRSERRSVDAYERQLDVLGHVAQRSDASAGIRKPTASELAQPHVKPSDPISDFLPSKNEYRPMSPPRVRLEPPVPPTQSVPVSQSAPLPVFGDDFEAITGRPLGKLSGNALDGRRSKMFRRHPKQAKEKNSQQPTPSLLADPVVEVSREVESPLFELDALVGAERPTMSFEDLSTTPTGPQSYAPRNIRSHRVSDHTHRRVLGAAAVFVIGAVAVGGWQIASKPSVNSPQKTASSSTKSPATKSHKTSPFSTSPGSSLDPVSNADGLVTYPAPSGTYTISFTSLSDCWLGIQPGSSSAGTYLAMKTLTSADTWSYQANGAILVRIGAPKTLSVKINGETVELPATVSPYDITFIPSDSTAA